MNIYFNSKTDYYIEIESTGFNLFAGICKKVSISENTFFVKLFPLSKQNIILPSFVSINLSDENCFVSSSLIKVHKITKDNFCIFVDDNFTSPFGELNQFSAKSGDYIVSQSQDLEIVVNNQKVFSTPEKFVSCEITEQHNLVFVLLKKLDHQKLLVFDSDNKLLVQDDITLFELTENGFQTLFELSDQAGHGIVKKYLVSESELTLEKQFTVYLEQKPRAMITENAKAIYFFECIKAQNVKLLKKMLSPELSKKITQEHLTSYFGNFERIFYSKEIFGCEAVSLIQTDTFQTKNFKLSFYSGLIDNIEAIE